MIERYRKGLAVVGAALVAALGVGGIAVAQNGLNPSSNSNSSPPAAAQPQSSAPEPVTGADTDSVQSGDQTTPDKPGTASESASTSASESAAEAPGQESAEAPGQETAGSEVPGNDGPRGHADEPGSPNADHQAQGVE